MIVQTDKDLSKAGLEESVDAEQENQDESLNWLLDMDLSEPEEKLFAAFLATIDYEQELSRDKAMVMDYNKGKQLSPWIINKRMK